MSLRTPILFCIFNRPTETERVFAAIRQQRPATLLVVQDGPRSQNGHDAAQIAAARKVLDAIDWPCELRTHFAETNLGCKRRMASGISWGFEQFEQLIILEDDCLPSQSFFGFCETLLDRFADDERVTMISGDNFQLRPRSTDSYYFSKWAHIWGWASWRRAWNCMDADLASWPAEKGKSWLPELCCDEAETAHWTELFDRQAAGAIDTWDFPWMYSCWRHGGLAAIPNRNLVTNIGFGPGATHTTDATSRLSNLPRREFGQLWHPENVSRHLEADAFTWEVIFKPPVSPVAVKSRVKSAGWLRGIRRVFQSAGGGPAHR